MGDVGVQYCVPTRPPSSKSTAATQKSGLQLMKLSVLKLISQPLYLLVLCFPSWVSARRQAAFSGLSTVDGGQLGLFACVVSGYEKWIGSSWWGKQLIRSQMQNKYSVVVGLSLPGEGVRHPCMPNPPRAPPRQERHNQRRITCCCRLCSPFRTGKASTLRCIIRTTRSCGEPLLELRLEA